MSQPILNALNNTQEYLNQFKILDKDHLGYLNVAQVKDYFESQQLPQDDLMALASRSNQGHLTPEQFASVMNLSEMKKNSDVGYHSSKFSSLSRHCEEAMELFQKDRRMKVPSNDSKDKLLEAFKALEDFAKQFIQSLDDEPQDNDRSLNGIIAPSTFEKMPGTFDFGNASSDNITSPELSMQIAPAAAPVYLKDPSLNDIPASPYARQNKKDPILDSPSPLPQMNDAADAFMSGGLKPISNRNLNGDDAKPNSAHENDTWRSSVLDSLRNATMNDTEVDDDDNDDSKEKEILSEEEPHERAIPSTSSDRGMTSNISTHAIEDVGVDSFKPSAIPLSSLNKESSDDGSTMEPISSISGPRDMNAEEALAPLVASVATVAAAAALSDNSKSNSHSANPLDSATTTKSYTPETFQGGLGGASSEPFIKNAKDTELKPEDQPSFEAGQAKSSMFNGTDDDSVARMGDATSGTHSALPKFGESNQFESESKPFEREAFQGGLGGDGTEPYIKNEKDTLLKPEEQPSFGAAEQERMSKLNGADQQQVESNDMYQPQVNKTFTNKGLMFVPESFQGDLGSDASEPYIKNNKNTLLRPEDQPLFGAEQEKLRGLSKADNENESVDELVQADKDAESSSSLGLALSKIGAGAAGTAGAAALGLFEHQGTNDKNKDRSSTFHPSNNASDHDLASPRNVYSPSLTSDNSLEDAIPSAVISNEALDNIADKVDADIKHNGLHDDSFTTNNNDAISSDALDKINDNPDAAMEDKDITGSAFKDVSPHKDFCVLVEQETSLPPSIGNEVDIKTANNGSNRSPITEKSSLPAAVSGNNDSTTASPGLNNEYIGGSSVMPDSSYRASPATNTAESHNLPLDATNTPSVSSSSHSLTPNDAIKNSSSRVSPEDGADNKEEKPGFFKRLFGATSKSPESAASSIPDGFDKVASKGSTSSADSKDSSIIAGASILDKVHAFNVNASQAAGDVNTDVLNDMSLNVHGADGSLVSSKFNANMPVNPHTETPDDFPHDTDKPYAALDAPKIDSDMNTNVDASGLSLSLEKSPADIKGLPDNVSGNCGSSVGFPNVDAKPASLDAELSGPHVDLPDVDDKKDSSIKSPDINAMLPLLNADANADPPDLSGSLVKLSSSLKDLGTDISDEISDSMNTRSIRGESPSLNTGLKKPNVELPDIDGKLPSVDADLETFNLDKPSLDGSFNTPDVDGKLPLVNTDFSTPNADLPNISGKLSRSISAPGVDRDIKLPGFNANVNMVGSNLSGSLGKLSVGLKDIKEDTSSKFEDSIDTPNVNGELPNVDAKMNADADLPPIDGKVSCSSCNLETPKLGKPSADGRPPYLSSDIKASSVDGKLPSADDKLKSQACDANIKVERPELSGSIGKLSSSFKDLKDITSSKLNGETRTVDGEAPSLNVDLKKPELPDVYKKLPHLDTDLSSPKLDKPSLDKLSTDLKSLKSDISGKPDGSIGTRDSDEKLPAVDANLKEPVVVSLPNVGDKFDGSLKTPGMGDNLPSLNSDLKSFDADLPNVDTDLNGSVGTLDANAKPFSLDDSLKNPNANLDTDVGASRPSPSGSLDKLPSSFKDLKKDISGKLGGSVDAPDSDGKLSTLDADMKDRDVQLPDINKELPSLDTDMKPRNVELPDVNKKLPSLDAAPKLEKPSLDGAFGTPNLEGKLSSLNNNIEDPAVELPSLSGEFDGSMDTPDINTKFHSIEADLKTPDINVDENVGANSPSLSGLGTLSSSFKNLKDSISGKFDDSADTPHVNGELPSLDTDLPDPNGKITALNTGLSSVKLGMPSIDGKLTNYMDPSTADAKLPAFDADLKKSDVDLPHVSGKLDRSTGTPDMNDKLPSIESGLKSPKMEANADLNPERPSLSGALGKLSSSSKGLKNDITGVFSGPADAPDVDGELSPVNTKPEGDMTAPGADVDVPDLHSSNFNASADGSNSAPIASLRKVEPSGSLGKIDTGLTTPKNDADITQVDAYTVVPVVPPRSPHLSLNKLPSDAHLDGSSNEDVNAPEASSRFKNPTFNVHVNSKPALEGDLSTELHRTASGKDADKTNDELSSSSFFNKPMEKISGAINSLVRDGDDDEAHGNNKTASGYTHPKTRLRTEGPEDLSDMLDGIVKRRFSNTPSESDVSSLKTDKMANKKSASGKSGQMDTAIAGHSAGVSEPHASLDGSRPRSFVSDSRFKELDEQERDATEYSTPLASPIIPNTAAVDRSSITAPAAPTVTLDKMDSLESDVEKQLYAMSSSVDQAPQVPAHEGDQLPSPSKTHRSSISLQSTSFQDRSAADAIKSIYDHMTSKLMTGGPKSGNGTDEDRVLKVRDGFENFNGFGVKCVSDNEDEEKHTAPPSSTLK